MQGTSLTPRSGRRGSRLATAIAGAIALYASIARAAPPPPAADASAADTAPQIRIAEAIMDGDAARAQALVDQTLDAGIADLRKDPGNDAAVRLAVAISGWANACSTPPLRGCADRFVDRPIARLAQTLAKDDDRLAFILDGVGSSWVIIGDLPRAQALLERSLAVHEASFARKGLTVQESQYGLLGVYLARHDFAAAVALEDRIDKNREQELGELVTSEPERIKQIVSRALLENGDTAISLHLAGAPSSKELCALALGRVIRQKGRILDEVASGVAALRGHATPENRALLERLLLIRSQIASLSLRGRPGAADVARLGKLAGEETALERQIGQAYAALPGKRPVITVAEVAAAIPEDAALVEIVAYQPVNPALFLVSAMTAPAANGAPGAPIPRRYAAYVLTHAGAAEGLDLGEASVIDAAAKKFREAVSRSSGDPKPAARALDAITLAKIRPILGARTKVFVSPDAALNLVPFGALVDENGRYLLERYAFTYLASGRDLARAGGRPPPREGMVIVADPAFDAGGARPARAPALRSIDISKTHFPRLPGTAVEADRIAREIPGVKRIMGDRATESAVKALRGPSVVHVATHGFVVLDEANAAPQSDDAADSPMLRAGLVLAGVNHGGRDGEDGVLTALEASSLDLYGTRLMVLSACETGLGDPSVGDGVYGLRRALTVAGVETLITSLWNLPDTIPADLMTAYYDRIRRGEGRSEALRAVELAMLHDPARSHPFFWASFIASGADGPLPDLMGAPAPPAVHCGCRTPGAADPPGGIWIEMAAIAVAIARRRRAIARQG